MIILLLILFAVLYFDARLLQKKDADGYRRVMEFSPPRWAFYGTLACLAMLPTYLLRRRRFFERAPAFEEKETVLADAFDVLLKWFCGVMVFVVVLKLIALFLKGLSGSLLALLLISGFSSFLLVWLIGRLSKRPGRPGFASLMATHKPQVPAVKAYAAAIAVGILFASISAYFLISRFETPSTPMGDALQGNKSSVVFLCFILLGLVIAPLLEEFIFRGYFFGVLKTFKGAPVAIAVIAVIFALLHVGQYWGDWLAIFMILLLGLELTLLRAWSGSVLPGVVTHYVYNTLVSVLPIVFLIASNPAYVKYVSQYPRLNIEAKEELLRESIQARPEFAEAYNDLAWLYVESRTRLPEAVSLADQALYHKPGNASFLDTKAEALYLLGRRDEAVAIGRKLVARFPSDKYYRGQLEKFEGKDPN